jgi:dTDP-4-amino-4,6-dideoxygalactose transaminase
LRSFFAGLVGKQHPVYLESDYSRPQPADQRYPYPASMPAFLARLGFYELERWSEEKANRKKMLASYLESLEKSVYRTSIPDVYKDPQRIITPLRFVFTPLDPEGRLLRRLSRHFDITWMWFRQPVICAVDGLESLDYYYGSCPASENICSNIINLPCNVFPGWEKKVLDAVHSALQQNE